MEKGLNKLSIADTSHLLSNVLPDDSHEPHHKEAWQSNMVNLTARQTTLIAYILPPKADSKTTKCRLTALLFDSRVSSVTTPQRGTENTSAMGAPN
jgi:hypothetical protein